MNQACFHFLVGLQTLSDFILSFVAAGYQREAVEEITQYIEPVEVHRIHGFPVSLIRFLAEGLGRGIIFLHDGDAGAAAHCILKPGYCPSGGICFSDPIKYFFRFFVFPLLDESHNPPVLCFLQFIFEEWPFTQADCFLEGFACVGIPFFFVIIVAQQRVGYSVHVVVVRQSVLTERGLEYLLGIAAQAGIMFHAFCRQGVCLCQAAVCIFAAFRHIVTIFHVFFFEGERLYQGRQQQFAYRVDVLRVEGGGE